MLAAFVTVLPGGLNVGSLKFDVDSLVGALGMVGRTGPGTPIAQPGARRARRVAAVVAGTCDIGQIGVRGRVDDRWTGLGCCGYWVEPRDDSGQT